MEPCSEGHGHLQLSCTLPSLLLPVLGSFCAVLGQEPFSPSCGWNVPFPGSLQTWKGWQVFEIHFNAWFYIKEFTSDQLLIMPLCFSARWIPAKCYYTVPKRPTRPWNKWGALLLLGLNNCFLVPLLPCEPQQEPSCPLPAGMGEQGELCREPDLAALPSSPAAAPCAGPAWPAAVQRARGCFSTALRVLQPR